MQEWLLSFSSSEEKRLNQRFNLITIKIFINKKYELLFIYFILLEIQNNYYLQMLTLHKSNIFLE